MYTVACLALSVLGDHYARLFPSTTFFGYAGAFTFPQRQFAEFEEVVNEGAVAFVDGKGRNTLLAMLKQRWKDLSDSYATGALSETADAFMESLQPP